MGNIFNFKFPFWGDKTPNNTTTRRKKGATIPLMGRMKNFPFRVTDETIRNKIKSPNETIR
jgi:hypothetical protein